MIPQQCYCKCGLSYQLQAADTGPCFAVRLMNELKNVANVANYVNSFTRKAALTTFFNLINYNCYYGNKRNCQYWIKRVSFYAFVLREDLGAMYPVIYSTGHFFCLNITVSCI